MMMSTTFLCCLLLSGLYKLLCLYAISNLARLLFDSVTSSSQVGTLLAQTTESEWKT